MSKDEKKNIHFVQQKASGCQKELIDKVYGALAKGTDYILSKQHEDGTWRDYRLGVGESFAWITSVVGVSLGKPPLHEACHTSLQKAVDAIIHLCTSNGWGYNPDVDQDADSSAWSVRFVLRMGYRMFPGILYEIFNPFINHDGQVKTFADAGTYGTWAESHQDVAPLVGLALHNVDGFGPLVRFIGSRILDDYDKAVPWRSFWWNTDSYAVAKSIEFLSAAGLLTKDIALGVADWLVTLDEADNAFEKALRLSIAVELNKEVNIETDRYVVELLKCQEEDGSWPGSMMLLVPPAFPKDTASKTAVHKDGKGLMTTATAIYALKQWVHLN